MINFLSETLNELRTFGYTFDDIIYIGNKEYSCTKEEFKKLADFEYDNGFGAPKIAYDLIIVLKDNTYLERVEYDGSESWNFVGPFSIPDNPTKLSRLVCNKKEIGWCSLNSLNPEETYD